MPDPVVERVVEEHPQSAGRGYLAAAQLVSRAARLPGVRRWEGAARRAAAVMRPEGPVVLHPLPAPPVAAPLATVTVLSANLWHDWPRQHRWRERLEALARLVAEEEVDLVLLQEVSRTGALDADAWLAERLGMACAYARANGDADALGFEEGVAVVSRFPLDDVHLHRLTRGRNPVVRRIALAAQVRHPAGPLLVVTAHLGLLRRHNPRQVQALRSWVDALAGDGPAVVGGDFNAVEETPQIAATRRAWTDTFRVLHPTADATTHPLGRGVAQRRRLDYVFLRQPTGPAWQVVHAGHLGAEEAPHSDHLAVLARLIPPAAP